MKHTMQEHLTKIPVKDIETFLLDLDGTLLDRYFDDYFWEHLVPERYAKMHNLSVQKAKEELLQKYKYHEGTLNWTDIDFWTDELGIDIPVLKEQVNHLIQVHPHVEAFLSMLKEDGRRVYLVTNAHFKTLEIKMRKTRLGRYFTHVITSFDMGTPKEDIQFWIQLEHTLRFDRNNSLFVDDTLAVLRTAKAFGIRYVVYKAVANSQKGLVHSDEFSSIADFRELMYR